MYCRGIAPRLESGVDTTIDTIQGAARPEGGPSLRTLAADAGVETLRDPVEHILRELRAGPLAAAVGSGRSAMGHDTAAVVTVFHASVTRASHGTLAGAVRRSLQGKTPAWGQANPVQTRFLQAYDYEELQAPIGTPDIELNLRMTAEGFQMEFVNTASGEVSRSVQKWEEVYGN